MTKARARSIYNELAKYFGLRARDAFLNPLSPTPVQGGSSSPAKGQIEANFLEQVFGQGVNYLNNAELSKSIEQAGDDLKNSVCVTTFDGTGFDKVQHSQFSDQGWGGTNFKLEDFLPQLKEQASNDVIAIQYFPISAGLDIVDTEIVSLFMNSLRTLTISQAVPYLEVSIISSEGSEEGNFSQAPKMSLGRFLSASPGDLDSEDATLAKFKSDIDLTGANRQPLSTVANMEVFTTPQTLVNVEGGTKYSRVKGGPIDKFRPFLSLMSLNVKDEFSGAGTISYKSAEMSLKLFDKGRLSEVSEFVAPRKDPNIKFRITYGWAHPSGQKIARKSDSNINDRLGELIDSMRVTEVYTLVNSGFTIGNDGTVDINLKLSMDSATSMGTKEISQFSLGGDSKVAGSISIPMLNRRLETIRKTILESVQQSGGRIELPVFLQAPSAEAMIQLDKKTITRLTKFAKTLKRRGGALTVAGAELYDIFAGNKSDASVVKQSREKIATDFVQDLATTPDPFLRSSASGAILENDLKKNLKEKTAKPNAQRSQTYVSFGKLMIKVLAPALIQEDGELQFIFSSFNQNAAAVYDYNIAQFPISIDDLKGQLSAELKRRPVITVDHFIRFVSDKFLTFHGLKAYGLSDLFKPNGRATKDGSRIAANRNIEKLIKSENPEDKLLLQKTELSNLNRVYGLGNRVNPTFTPPRVTMRLETKESSNKKKTVTRIFFQDLAAGRLMSLADSLMNLIRRGYLVTENYAGRDPNKRGAKHNEIFQKNYQKLISLGIVGDTPSEVLDKMETELRKKPNVKSEDIVKLRKKLSQYQVLLKTPDDVRKFFFENSPYLLHGTEGSGIIEATLGAETDDKITSMFLAQRFSGKGDSTRPERPINLPFETHPATLTVKTFGCPYVGLTQKYFIDFATNTTLDNYYVCTSVSHEIQQGTYLSSLEFKPYDIWGSVANAASRLDDVVLNLALKDVPAQKPKKRKKKAAKSNDKKSDDKKSDTKKKATTGK